MQTLSIAISDLECAKFGIKGNSFAFSDFLELVSREVILQNYNSCLDLAEKYGLSTMSMDEIDEEVREARAERWAL